MAAGKYSFIIEQGATFKLNLVWTDSADNSIDISGWEGRMHIRPSIDSSDIYIALSSSLQDDGTGIDLSGDVIPTESGSMFIYISAHSSSLLEFSDAYYDLELEKNGEVVRLLEGKVRLSKNVTR